MGGLCSDALERLDCSRDAFGGIKHGLPGGGQAVPTRQSLDETELQPPLQVHQSTQYRRLVDPQRPRSCQSAATPGNDNKML